MKNIDQNKILIGSFQKDGDGWGDGNVPKLIKGPDLFLKTIKILKEDFSMEKIIGTLLIITGVFVLNYKDYFQS